MRLFSLVRGRALSLIVTVLLVCAAVFAGWNVARVQQAAVALCEEMVLAVDGMLGSLQEGDMVLVEAAAMRFWRLAEINRQLTPWQPYARSLHDVATDLSEIAAGWHSMPLSAEQHQGVRLQLISLREMVKAHDLSKANAILAWLQTP